MLREVQADAILNRVDYVSEVTDSLSGCSPIDFLSRYQLPVLTSQMYPKYNKLVIFGGFGTARTFLLREKAIMLSQQPAFKGKILYVACNGKGLLYYSSKLDLEPYGIIAVSEVNLLSF